jgi:uncharacterized phage protein (TIGR02218 family)
MPVTIDITQLSRYTTLWRLIALDGSGIDVTTATGPMVYDGVTYGVASLVPSQEQHVENLEPSNMEITLSMAAAGVTKEDLLGGRWDGARVEIRHYDWANDVVEQTWRGVLNSVVYDNGAMKAEVLDVALLFQQVIGDVYQDTCRTGFGSPLCGATPNTVVATVTGFTARDTVTFTLTEPEDNFYQQGKITFTSGANTGLSKEIRSSSQSGPTLTVSLLENMRHAIAVGDTVILSEGCAHTFPACIRKGRAKDFQGEYGIPGRNRLFSWPTKK